MSSPLSFARTPPPIICASSPEEAQAIEDAFRKRQCGSIVSTAAIAEIAGNYELSFSDVHTAMQALPAEAAPLFNSPAGWAALGQSVADMFGLGSFPPLSVGVH